MRGKMNGWNVGAVAAVVIEVEAANTEEAIRQKLIEMGWTPPDDAYAAYVAARNTTHAAYVAAERELVKYVTEQNKKEKDND
tara:strand:- start:66 stop:311 length:246 start_codon:yes stop_codon:yes gene_type:complete